MTYLYEDGLLEAHRIIRECYERTTKKIAMEQLGELFERLPHEPACEVDYASIEIRCLLRMAENV